MIIDDQDGASSRKDAPTPAPAVARPPDASEQPPPYYSARSTESDSLLPIPVCADPSHRPKRQRRRASRRATKRFYKALLVAVAILFAASWILWGPIGQSFGFGRHHRPLDSVDDVGGDIVFCMKTKDWKFDRTINGPWDDGRYAVQSLKFPPDISSLFLITHGLESGSIEHNTGVSFLGTTSLQTELPSASLLSYTTARDIGQILDVCLLSRAAGEYGLALIFANGTRASVGVDILLPPNHKVRNIDVNMANTAITFIGLNESYGLENITVRSSGNSLNSLGVHAKYLDLRTTNGAVAGSFSASQEIALQNSNSFMEVSTFLSHTDDASESKVSLVGENSRIAAKTYFTSKNKTSGRGGSFVLNATSTKGHINFSVDQLPLDALLNVTMETKRGSAILNVPPTYEGLWQMTSRHGGVALDTDNNTGDPYGRNRQRRSLPYDETFTRGIIWWQEPKPAERIPRQSPTKPRPTGTQLPTPKPNTSSPSPSQPAQHVPHHLSSEVTSPDGPFDLDPMAMDFFEIKDKMAYEGGFLINHGRWSDIVHVPGISSINVNASDMAYIHFV